MNYGNVLKGWDFYISLKKGHSAVNNKKNCRIVDKNRVFSLTSASSKIWKDF